MVSKKQIQKAITQLADSGVRFARNNFGIQLDYSEESVTQVERILQLMHADIKDSRPTSSQIKSVSSLLGAYLGEVVRRKWGGRWYMSRHGPQKEQVHTLEISGHSTFPINKVYKRLLNGEVDDVRFYYKALIDAISRGFV